MRWNYSLNDLKSRWKKIYVVPQRLREENKYPQYININLFLSIVNSTRNYKNANILQLFLSCIQMQIVF